ncbi:SRPBCC family protein [Nocardioides sp. ChNu-99]|nr:SRPBCC family protein [Nocardioides sp. ChNu-99]
MSAPREVVRTYLADFSNTVEWDPPTVKCVRRDAGEPRVGSTWDNTTKMGRSTTELVYELTELTDTGLVFRGENGSVVAEDHITFVETGPGRTRITYHATLSFKGFRKLADPIAKLGFTRLAKDVVANITREVEKRA